MIRLLVPTLCEDQVFETSRRCAAVIFSTAVTAPLPKPARNRSHRRPHPAGILIIRPQ